MNRDMMQAAELAVMPPMLTARDGIFSTGFNLTPGAINYGGVDDQGRQLAIPMQFGNSLPIGMEMMEQKRQIINDALWNTLFQILVQTPNMTATEAMLRAQEKGALLARVDFDQAAKVMLEVSGVPARVIRGDDEVQALMEQRQEQQAQEMQAQQQQQILAAAPVAASAAKDLAQAQVLAATAEQGPMPGVLPG